MKNIIAILRLSRSLYPIMIAILVIIITGVGFEIVTPLLSGRVLDEVVKQAGNANRTYNDIFFLLGISLAASLFAIVLRSVGQRLGDHLAGRIRKLLTEIFYDKAFTLPQSYYDSEVSGKIVNQLNRGIATIQGFLQTMTNYMIPSMLQGVVVIAILAYYNVFLGILMLAIFPVYFILSSNSTKRWGKKEEAKNKIEDKTRGRIQEVITNMKLVKGFTNERNEYNYVSNNLTEINNIYRKQSTEYHLFDYARETILFIILFSSSALIFYSALVGAISIGTVIILIQLVERARYPLFGLSFVLEQIQATEAGSKEFIEILNLKSVENYKDDEKVEKITAPKIEFKDVGFKYASAEENVLEKISFTLNKDEMVALVGPSGAGKSTIVNLILKFYETTAGDILLNGKNYKDLTHNFVRKNIALVFQENELFSSTIKENVAYGAQVDDEKVIEALKKANAWSFVSTLKDTIDTEVGERGIRLSGGQRQRIQIARAIYKDAPILILDEATSSLDAKSESEVSEAIDNLVKDRMVIVIAHRFSTIQNANKIIVLNDKKVEAMGTPQELASQEGIYSDLLKYQVEGNKKLLKKFEIY